MASNHGSTPHTGHPTPSSAANGHNSRTINDARETPRAFRVDTSVPIGPNIPPNGLFIDRRLRVDTRGEAAPNGSYCPINQHFGKVCTARRRLTVGLPPGPPVPREPPFDPSWAQTKDVIIGGYERWMDEANSLMSPQGAAKSLISPQDAAISLMSLSQSGAKER